MYVDREINGFYNKTRTTWYTNLQLPLQLVQISLELIRIIMWRMT